MLIKVHQKDSNESFFLYDTEPLDVSLEDIGLVLESDNPELSDLPIYPLNELLLKGFGFKKRSISQRLEECGIFTYNQLCSEYLKILNKQSSLSFSQRELVSNRFKEIANIIENDSKATKEEDNPSESA